MILKFGIRPEEEVGRVRRGSVAGDYTRGGGLRCGDRPVAVGHYWRRKAVRQLGRERGRVPV